MIDKYNKHFLLDIETIITYVKNKKLFDDDAILKAEEIGDGNINYVFRIFEEKTKKSVVLKQADKLLRSSGRPLDIGRSKIEAKILEIEGELAENFVPKIYFYDEIMAVLAMEDISEYKNLRKELLNGKIFEIFAESISEFLAKTLFLTTDLVLKHEKKKFYVKKFINPELCEISEQLVLTEPYINDRHRNIVTDGNEKFVEENLYKNKELHLAVAKLKDKFMNKSQSLIHGDLHSGSIFINKNGIKIIDPEFAFYGPMAYDVGNVIANLYFPLLRVKYFGEEKDYKFMKWLEKCIEEIPRLFLEKVDKLWDENVIDEFRREIKFKEYYLSELKREIDGYTGTEIIRRVVGDTKVIELSSLDNTNKKLEMERELIKKGVDLILNSDK